jgi:hypothetical protein
MAKSPKSSKRKRNASTAAKVGSKRIFEERGSSGNLQAPSTDNKQANQSLAIVPIHWYWLAAFGCMYLLWLGWLSYAAWVNVQAGNQ